jgi:DNA end-binding protein Ku
MATQRVPLIEQSDKKAKALDLAAQLANAMNDGKKTEAPSFEKKLASRPVWTGNLSFAMMVIPVKSYKATDIDTISFNQLHKSKRVPCPKHGFPQCTNCDDSGYVSAPCGMRLKQGTLVCSGCGAEVAKDEVAKGFEHSKDQYVTVTPDELASCTVRKETVMEITEFVSADAVDPIYFESTEYLSPGEGGDGVFALLRAGMIATAKVAVARRSQRGREQTFILRPYSTNGIAIHYMFFEHEIRAFDKWHSTEVPEKHLHLMSQLIEANTEAFEPEKKFDSYTVNLKKLLANKAAGIELPKFEQVPEVVPVEDIMAALKASLDKSKTKRGK